MGFHFATKMESILPLLDIQDSVWGKKFNRTKRKNCSLRIALLKIHLISSALNFTKTLQADVFNEILPSPSHLSGSWWETVEPTQKKVFCVKTIPSKSPCLLWNIWTSNSSVSDDCSPEVLLVGWGMDWIFLLRTHKAETKKPVLRFYYRALYIINRRARS